MGFLFTSSKREQTVAIFDIGSGSVGGAISRMPTSGEGTPVIIKSARTDMAFRNNQDFQTLLTDMQTALDTTAKALYDSKVGAPDKIVCVLASPWYISETRVIKMKREHSFIFKKSVADELLEKEISGLVESYQKKYTGVEGTSEVIEHHIMGVSLNGYTVDDPLGKHTKAIEMNMIISLSPKLCLDRIRETLLKTFHGIKIEFSSFIVSSYLAVRDRYVTASSYLLVDVGGEITDIAIVGEGVLRTSLSFPFGKNTLLKHICQELSIDKRDARELFTLFTSNTLEEKKRNKILPLFTSLENSWNEAFMQAVGTLSSTMTVPSTIFLTTDIDTREWFYTILCNQEYIQSIVSEHKCIVITLEGPEFLNMCRVKDGLCDPFLMIESIAIMRKMEK
jgi:hypothetical protein